MRWRDTFRSAMDAVSTHRLRSALTMLGILIGIGAVVLTVGLGDGAKAQVREQIDALGTNLLVITPGRSIPSTGGRASVEPVATTTLFAVTSSVPPSFLATWRRFGAVKDAVPRMSVIPLLLTSDSTAPRERLTTCSRRVCT